MSHAEYSPIQVNEATWTELQSLPGIGPRRADRLIAFRREIAPLRTPFDLATATGLSLRQAEKLAHQIDWQRTRGLQSVGTIPFLMVVLACFWLMSTGFLDVLQAGSGTGILSAGLACLLAGLLLVTGKLVIDSLLRRPGGGRLQRLGLLIASAGVSLIAWSNYLMTGAQAGIELEALQDSTRTVNGFLLAIAVITILMYGPALSMRYLISEYRRGWLRRIQFLYDGCLPLVGLAPVFTVFWDQTTRLPDIFALWTGALMIIAGLDQLALRSPFVESLSDQDQGRLRFLRRDERGPVLTLPYPRLFALVTLVTGVGLIGLAVSRLFF